MMLFSNYLVKEECHAELVSASPGAVSAEILK
jgi:hypothetical protein